jgi:hypothetical protein
MHNAQMDERLFDAITVDGTTYRNLSIDEVSSLASKCKLTKEDSLRKSGTEKWVLCSKVKGIQFQDKQSKNSYNPLFKILCFFAIAFFSFILIPWFIRYLNPHETSTVPFLYWGLIPFIPSFYLFCVLTKIFAMERNKKRISSLKPAPGEISSEVATEETIKNLNNWFKIGWICAAAGIPLTLIIIGIFGVIAYVIFACLLIHKLWQIIPPEERETTPGKAVGCLFIPIFHWYWWYVSFLGLAKCLNAQTAKNQIKGNQVNEKFALVICILVPFGYIPYLGLLTGIVQIVFLILTIQQMKNAGIALIQKQLESE